MCAVSAVYDYFGTKPISIWDRPTFDEFKEILERLEKIDKKLDQPECEDPAKAAWMREVEERLAALEKE